MKNLTELFQQQLALLNDQGDVLTIAGDCDALAGSACCIERYFDAKPSVRKRAVLEAIDDAAVESMAATAESLQSSLKRVMPGTRLDSKKVDGHGVTGAEVNNEDYRLMDVQRFNKLVALTSETMRANANLSNDLLQLDGLIEKSGTDNSRRKKVQDVLSSLFSNYEEKLAPLERFFLKAANASEVMVEYQNNNHVGNALSVFVESTRTSFNVLLPKITAVNTQYKRLKEAYTAFAARQEGDALVLIKNPSATFEQFCSKFPLLQKEYESMLKPAYDEYNNALGDLTKSLGEYTVAMTEISSKGTSVFADDYSAVEETPGSSVTEIIAEVSNRFERISKFSLLLSLSTTREDYYRDFDKTLEGLMRSIVGFKERMEAQKQAGVEDGRAVMDGGQVNYTRDVTAPLLKFYQEVIGAARRVVRISEDGRRLAGAMSEAYGKTFELITEMTAVLHKAYNFDVNNTDGVAMDFSDRYNAFAKAKKETATV